MVCNVNLRRRLSQNARKYENISIEALMPQVAHFHYYYTKDTEKSFIVTGYKKAELIHKLIAEILQIRLFAM